MMRFALALALVGTACTSGTPVEPEKPAEVEEAANEPEVKAIPPSEGRRDGLVPSILETQRALEAAGVETKLATLVKPRTYDMAADAPDRAAVRTGVVLADMLLTVTSSDKDTLNQQLEMVRRGMKQLNGGSDIDATIADYQERVKADAVSREELVAEFDELSGAVIPELEFNGNARVVPLISAGSWLEGTHLVATALANTPADKRGEAEKLLKAPTVVDYFTEYVEVQGAAAPEPVTAQLKSTLGTLKELATKAEPLSDAELAQIGKTTGDVLSLL